MARMEAGLSGTRRELPDVLQHAGRGFRSSQGIQKPCDKIAYEPITVGFTSPE